VAAAAAAAIRRNARIIKIKNSTSTSTIPWSGLTSSFYISLPFLQKFPRPLSHHIRHSHRSRLHLPHQLKTHQMMRQPIKRI
jgi:hypothetical protein